MLYEFDSDVSIFLFEEVLVDIHGTAEVSAVAGDMI